VPDITVIPISDLNEKIFLLAASDGLFDHMGVRDDCGQVDVLTDYLRTGYEREGMDFLTGSVVKLVERDTEFFARHCVARYDDITIQLVVIE
jgi:hypothetical protein